MGERRGTKALELWCRRITDGYPGVNVQNMTTSWRDGLAFCAMIHHFRPDLIDFNSLNKDDVYGNNELAFRTAEQHLGIPALLDAEDMASCAVPDRLSILTYLSQFYQTFGGTSPSRLAMSRTTETSEERISRPVTESPKPKVVSRLGMRRDPCAVCGLPVFLAEKLVIDHMPYHRTCFRCARCSNQLTPGNYYETEDGQYCCETCPDEEPAPSSLHASYDEDIANDHRTSAIPTDEYVAPANRQRSLSDEEKTEQRILKSKDIYMKLQDTAVSDVTSQTAQLRLDFMANHLLSEKSSDPLITDDPEPAKPVKMNSYPYANRMVDSTTGQTVSVDSAFPDGDEEDGDEEDVDKDEDNEPTSSCASTVSASPIHEKSPAPRIDDQINELQKEDCLDNTVDARLNSAQSPEKERIKSRNEASLESPDIKRFLANQSSDTSTVQASKNNVYNAQNINLLSRSEAEKDNQHVTAILPHDIHRDKGINNIDVAHKKDNTKDPSTHAEKEEDASAGLSLVQKRLKMFENREKKEHAEKDNEVGKKDTRTSGPASVSSREELPVGSDDRNEKISALKPQSRTLELRNEIPSPREHSLASMQSELFAERKSISNRINSTATQLDAPSEKKLPVVEIIRSNQTKTFADVEDSEANKRLVPKISLDGTPRNDRAVSSKKSENVESSNDDINIAERKDEPVTDESASEINLSTAKGIDLSNDEDYPESLNPFNDEDEGQDEDRNTKSTLDSSRGSQRSTVRTVLDSSRSSKVSTNPFDSDVDEEEVEVKHVVPPKPAVRKNMAGKNAQQVQEVPAKRKLVAPQISLNPFWSDEEEEHDSGTEVNTKHTSTDIPVPKPRTIKNTPELGTMQRKTELNRGGFYASNSSITSSESTTTPGGTYRKKKPAPPPPIAKELFPPGQQTSPASKSLEKPSFNQQNTSPRTTPRTRKSKPAPPPPMPTSSPYSTTSAVASLTFNESPITDHANINDNPAVNLWEDQKTNKDEANRNRQSLTIPCEDNQPYSAYTDKSVQGKWKRKKGPAPPRPIPHRRKIKVMSMKDVKLELDEIEVQQQGLEKQGVRLEQIIRDRCESAPQNDESSLSIDVEELVLELFALVNEKNELFRRQAELMLLKRQQRLEEEHAEVEYQIRCLMCRPEATKTDFDKQREESLIQRLVEIVERRNEIVECLEMDRRREVEEDRSIHTQMGLFAAKNKSEVVSNNNDNNKTAKGKKSKTKEKGKEKKTKSLLKKDADKDVDETEIKLKHHNKRKWF